METTVSIRRARYLEALEAKWLEEVEKNNNKEGMRHSASGCKRNNKRQAAGGESTPAFHSSVEEHHKQQLLAGCKGHDVFQEDLGPGRLWTVVDDTNNYDCDLFEFKRSSKSPAADLVDEELRRKESVHTAPFSSEEPARNNQQHRRDQHEETRSDGSSVSSSRRGDLLLRNKAGSIRLPSEGKFRRKSTTSTSRRPDASTDQLADTRIRKVTSIEKCMYDESCVRRSEALPSMIDTLKHLEDSTFNKVACKRNELRDDDDTVPKHSVGVVTAAESCAVAKSKQAQTASNAQMKRVQFKDVDVMKRSIEGNARKAEYGKDDDEGEQAAVKQNREETSRYGTSNCSLETITLQTSFHSEDDDDDESVKSVTFLAPDPVPCSDLKVKQSLLYFGADVQNDDYIPSPSNQQQEVLADDHLFRFGNQLRLDIAGQNAAMLKSTYARIKNHIRSLSNRRHLPKADLLDRKGTAMSAFKWSKNDGAGAHQRTCKRGDVSCTGERLTTAGTPDDRKLKRSGSCRSVSSWRSRRERNERSYLKKLKEELLVSSSSNTDVERFRPRRRRRTSSKSSCKSIDADAIKALRALAPEIFRDPLKHFAQKQFLANDLTSFGPYANKATAGQLIPDLAPTEQSLLKSLSQVKMDNGKASFNSKHPSPRSSSLGNHRPWSATRRSSRPLQQVEDMDVTSQQDPQRRESFNRLLDTYLKKNEESMQAILKTKLEEKKRPQLRTRTSERALKSSSSEGVQNIRDTKKFWREKELDLQRKEMERRIDKCFPPLPKLPTPKLMIPDVHEGIQRVPAGAQKTKPERMAKSNRERASKAVEAMLQKRLEDSRSTKTSFASSRGSRTSKNAHLSEQLGTSVTRTTEESLYTVSNAESHPYMQSKLPIRGRSAVDGKAGRERSSRRRNASSTKSSSSLDAFARQQWVDAVEGMSCGKKKGSTLCLGAGDVKRQAIKQSILEKIEQRSNSDDIGYILPAHSCNREDWSVSTSKCGLVDDQTSFEETVTKADSTEATLSFSSNTDSSSTVQKELAIKKGKSNPSLTQASSTKATQSMRTMSTSDIQKLPRAVSNKPSGTSGANGSESAGTVSATTVESAEEPGTKRKMRIIHVKKLKVKGERSKHSSESRKKKLIKVTKAKSDSTLALKKSTLNDCRDERAKAFREKLAKMTKSEMRCELVTAEGELLALEHKFKNSLKECVEIRKDLSSRGVEHVAITFAHLPIIVDLLDLGDYLLDSLLSSGSGGDGDGDGNKWLSQESVTKAMIKVLDTICFILQQAALRPVLLLIHWLEKVFEALKDSKFVATLSRWKARILEGAYAFVSKGSSGFKEFQTASIEVAQNLGRKSSEISRKLYKAGLLPPSPEEAKGGVVNPALPPASPNVRINNFKQDMLKMLQPIMNQFSEDESMPNPDQLYPEAWDPRAVHQRFVPVMDGPNNVDITWAQKKAFLRNKVHLLTEDGFKPTNVEFPSQVPRTLEEYRQNYSRSTSSRPFSHHSSRSGSDREAKPGAGVSSGGDGIARPVAGASVPVRAAVIPQSFNQHQFQAGSRGPAAVNRGPSAGQAPISPPCGDLTPNEQAAPSKKGVKSGLSRLFQKIQSKSSFKKQAESPSTSANVALAGSAESSG